ncbi:DnaB-like helicase C-terminal domain-containing protein [Legionella pneumophila]|uniref:DnaB-like helicase C-terminal domain-containing protein n=1 Tax=Legionella pneumophila TaxID=446 RepID=UPI000AA17B4D|nr:hypothetical protein [Legionella pneumophila]HAT1881551.1 hypothetical protein [Legionella pneumophila]HBD7102125.1 hypothetical protein [Legionella pneumophila]HCO4740138.1 hypothetical protein [Legionella pneumophila]HDU7930081.1 hypothetical protein [Legionella pneumophila]HDU7934811.1 hypothetical protein [Legionella pneumophila]
MMSFSKSIPSIKSLKLSAKKIASTKNIPLSQALDLVANEYGFTHWSLLHKYFKSVRMNNVESIWKSFLPGEMLLLSAAEGAGKLSFALNLALYAAQIKLPVKYYSMHVNASFIFERLNKISCQNLECDLQQDQYMEVEEKCFDQNTLIEKIKKDKPGSLLIIDYLQAIVSHGEIDPYHDFVRELKLIAQQHTLRVLILSQVNQEVNFESLEYIAGGGSISRHFAHVIHIEPQQREIEGEREIVLVKSIHYQKQKSLLQFNKDNYCFI